MGAFDSFSDFLAMGDRAVYVWSVYGLFLIVFVANMLAPKFMRASLLKEERRRRRREEQL